ncbi:serine hydrolase domain-containing protein [Neobacillus bataviensis]|uniref:serine hydrolase domain-containing protein n=1 Tax=Neobacillus bataviensis TaxID=220685 RepID=UPI001CBA80B4|nr:serine hydrolase domain-containing protein [Neobacillus bataviensis]
MKILLIAIFSFGIFSSACSEESIRPAAASHSEEIQIHQKIREYLVSNHVSGSIAVAKNGSTLFSEGTGYSDISKRTLNRPTTTYPIGSITKTMVAVCILQLQEKGLLRIHDSVSKYVPTLPKNVKIAHLLNHTSGIKGPIWHTGIKNPKDIIKKAVVKFPAGTKWEYNDINYIVLGYIVEQVTGGTLHDYIEKNIFHKASMVNAGFINSGTFSSKGYFKVAGQFLQSSKLNPSLLFGCGDIYATAKDLYLFDEALMTGKLLTKQSVKKMVTPGPKSSYGLGVYHKDDRIYSRGVVGGWESLHVYYKDKTSIVVLLNVRDKQRDIKKLSADIYRIVKEEF